MIDFEKAYMCLVGSLQNELEEERKASSDVGYSSSFHSDKAELLQGIINTAVRILTEQ